MNIKQSLNWANNELVDTKEPKSAALVLLGEILDMTRTELLAKPEIILTKSQEKNFKEYIKRRKAYESVWLIIGKVGFWGLEFFVNKDVLVPRPETEILVEEVVNYILGQPQTTNQKSLTLLDMGTGSGTIAIALSCEFPELKIIASDISEKALKIARKNKKHNNAKNIEFIQADLFTPIADHYLSFTSYDIICANLPYIPEEEIESLDFDVHHYEPKIALNGGKNGLELYEKFFSEVPKYLNENGAIFCEIGIKQSLKIDKIIKRYLPKAKIEILDDLAEIDRVVIIKT